MSAHRKPAAPRFGARHLLGGAAMTAVFLGAGTGVALAGTTGGNSGGESEDGALSESVQLLCDNLENVTDEQLVDEDLTRDGLALLCGAEDDEGDEDNDKAEGDKADDDKAGDKAGDNCGCEKHDSEPVVKDENKNDCPPEEKSDHKSDHKSTEVEDTESESSPEETESESTPEDTESVESESTPEVETVASISDVADETTPVGAAETGDGSSSPGFTPTFAPAASSSPLGEQVALGGGLAAAALLGGFGVQVARRRTGAHRK